MWFRPRPRAELEVGTAAAEIAVPVGGRLDGLWYTLAKYSLSFDIGRGLAGRWRAPVLGSTGTTEWINNPELWRRAERFWYADNPYAARNRSALGEMKAYADELGVPLLVLLIPPK